MTQKQIKLTEEELSELIRSEVRRYMAEIFGVSHVATQSQKEWYDPEEAWSLLDLPNVRTLKEMRENGIFEFRKHFRIVNRKPNARNPRYQFHIENCKKRLLENPAKYAKPKN